MKKILFYVLLIFSMITVSCTNDAGDFNTDKPVFNQPEKLQLVQTPNITASTNNGGKVFYTTISGTRADDYRNATYIDFKTLDDHSYDIGQWYPEYKAHQPAFCTDAEKEFVVNYIETHNSEGLDVFPDTIDAYFITDCGSSRKEYSVQARQWDPAARMNKYVDLTFNVADVMTTLRLNAPENPGDTGNGSGYAITSNAGAFSNPLTQSMGLCVFNGNPILPAKYGEKNNNRWYNDQYKVFVIEYNGEIGYYLGLNYVLRGDEGKFLGWEDNGIYNDWVLKFVPADGRSLNPIVGPVPEPHPYVLPEGVEVNLAVNDTHEKDDWIQSKLSIHARYATDFEVFIPVPKEYYCPADDMNIVYSHQLEQEVYAHSIDVDGNIVEVTIAYEDDGIRITSSGINESVINYCNEEYGDGLTFEVFNYYNTLSRAELRNYLDQTTIAIEDGAEFKCAKNPDQELGGYDCTVTRITRTNEED